MKSEHLQTEVAIKQLTLKHGGDAELAIQIHREVQAIWDMPIEERQAAYEALKARYPGAAFAMIGPGIEDEE